MEDMVLPLEQDLLTLKHLLLMMTSDVVRVKPHSSFWALLFNVTPGAWSLIHPN
jgi:hypothetical protein